MPFPPHNRRQLPLADGHIGRSAMTCIYRCGNACAHPAPNVSDNEYFGDMVAKAVSRRGLFKASAAGALVLGIGTSASRSAAAAEQPVTAGSTAAAGAADPVASSRASGSALTFPTVPPNTLDAVVVPNGYDHSIVVRWGDPVVAGAPAFDFDRQTPQAQEQQFGYNCDFVWFMPTRGNNQALLVVNHEYTNEELMFRGYTAATATPEHARIAMAAHGLSVVEIERVDDTGSWRLATKRTRVNRRITAMTPMVLTGPAAGDELLKTAADATGTHVLGTLNNCGGGTTPWGTVLTGEENFNQYFVGANGVPATATAGLKRYGFATDVYKPASGYRGWEKVEPRFDLTKNPNEANRFGYVVEIDPYDPEFVPRKRTALGRMKHEAADCALTKEGRVVAYMGDDERFDYLYKYVSTQKFRAGSSRSAREHNLTLLDEGTLYVAKLTGNSPAAQLDGTGKLPSDGSFDGVGEWIPLVTGDRSFVPGMSAAEVLVLTRLAADKVGATKMDRPEEVERNPVTGKVYVALTNNSDRGAAGKAGPDEANPRNGNRHGQILELTENGDDGAATGFTWSLPIICGDPADPSSYFLGYDKTKVSPVSCPDNLAFDKAGNLWISTDGNALKSNDGLFAVPLEGPEKGHLRQFLTVPRGAETCGPLITPDQETCFIAVQHPGEVTGATADNPVSTWPDGGPVRPSVISVWRTAEGSKRIGA
jgi:secreted PhoX family phosphatase